ncbi:MAG: mtaB [Clostridiales bacterium]|jgi:threonylcarbamoyladenosine tRNA methylthiotransferase MtaB|nr:mtaB [Clostridiales bacterium]
MNRVGLHTLGCRVNQYETEAIAEAFIKKNYEVVDFDTFADVYVINTCTVTSIGDKKSRQMIRKAKKINPEAVVVVAGCYAQVAPDEVAKIEGVDIIIGTFDKGKAVELVEEYKKNQNQIKKVDNIMSIREFEELEIDAYQDRTRAFLKIQDGCNRYCSYCLIPYARGPVRSRTPVNIIKEVKKLASNGFKEIILSGIHVASYGFDLENVSLEQIIELTNEIPGIERIRIGSVEPMFFNEARINKLSSISKFCPHFHLSLQSGCDATLKRMNRHYTSKMYMEAVDRIREAFKDASITTDIIVGFPGETEEEFNSTYEFLRDIKLSKMHVFKYSPRKGTRAAEFKEQVPGEIKDLRSKKLLALDERLEKEYIDKFTNREMDVLFEETNDNISCGYTRNYIKVCVKSESDISGKILDVKLVNNLGNMAQGNIL